MSDLRDNPVPDGLRNEVLELSERDGISQSDIQHDKGLRAAYRELAQKSLYFFAKAVCGYRDLTLRTHYEFASFVQDTSNRFILTLFPRGCFKTSIGTKAFAPWYLINHPDHSILIANQVARNAELMLNEIEQFLDGGNVMFNWLFPEFIKPGDRWKPWSTEMMTIPCGKPMGGPSIMTIGVGGRAESLHFHVIINDDLIGEKAMESDREMVDVIAWHDYSTSLFVSPATGIERVYGTRWDLSDLYSVLLEDPKYKVMIREAQNEETGEAFFPEFLPIETLREIRERNYAYYMSQYMNNPANPEMLDFRPGWLKRYLMVKTKEGPSCEAEGAKCYVKDMNLALLVDPAGSGDIERRVADDLKRGRARKSNNAVEVWGLHGSNRYFLLDLWAGRGVGENPELEVATKMLEMVKRWRGYLFRGYVESYGAQRGLITVFNMLSRGEGLFFTLEEIPRGQQQAKKVRIRTYLGPPAQNGQVFCRNSHDQFIYEWGKYPQSDLFDCLDAAAWAFHILRPPPTAVDDAIAKRRTEQKRQERLRVIGRAGY
jgi:hypothetical protein